MKITLFGTGYVGLVQAAVFADAGYETVCIDVDGDKIDRLQRGEIPIYEPGLEDLVRDNHAAGRLHFTTDAASGVAHGSVLFIAVGTPPDEDGSADLSHVLSVAETIGRHMEADKTIAVKSTVPVGTSDKVRAAIATALDGRNRHDLSFDVTSNPEFLKEGSAVADCRRPDRIIIGTSDPRTEQTMRELYAPFNRNHEKIIVMDALSAEMTKYAANCMLATKITFMNEMAGVADLVGADIEHVRKGIGSDPRIGYDFIYPGIGYGGSCFPKDVRAMIQLAGEQGFETSILKAVEARNEDQKEVLVKKIAHRFGDDLSGRHFALWGLAFKPNTDDMREAPSRAVMEALWQRGARVSAFDPAAMQEAARLYDGRNDLTLCATKEDALNGADALVICTEWKAFAVPDFDMIRSSLKTPVIFDGRNIYDPAIMARHGIDYYAVGRGLRP